MAKYIDKDALVAEIERRISLFKKEKKTEKWSAGASQINVVSLGARIAMLEEIKVLLDTLEVKEVDLEKEFKHFLDDVDGTPPVWESYSQIEWGKDIAKHFFELGLKVAQKG